MSVYATHSNPVINQASTEFKNEVIQKLKDSGYIFRYEYNDLYFLKSGQTVRRLKGYIHSVINTYPDETDKEFEKKVTEYYTLDINSFLRVKQLIQSLSNDKFDCDFNKLKLNKADHYGYWNEAFTYILKITNKVWLSVKCFVPNSLSVFVYYHKSTVNCSKQFCIHFLPFGCVAL